MIDKRRLEKLKSLQKKYDELVDEHIEMFFEKRPDTWKRAGIKKTREDLEKKMKENEYQREVLLDEILNTLKDRLAKKVEDTYTQAKLVFNEK